MSKQGERTFASAIGTFTKACVALEILMAFLVVIPLTLWLVRSHHSRKAETIVLNLFCLSFAWANLSLLRWRRSLDNFGSSSRGRLSFGLGPRPSDSDELRLWQVGIHLQYSSLAVILTMAAFAITKWLNGE